MLAYIICKVLGIECTLIYNQSPLYSHVASSQSNLKKLIRKYLFPRVRITTVKSRNVNRFAENEKDYFIDEKDYFLPFVVEANHSAVEREYFKNGKINILDVGKYRDYKNHFVLVDAINKIKQKSNLSVTIVGQVSNNEEKKYYNSLKEYIVNHNLDSIIKLKKNMKFNDMNDLYLTHDIFILPSKVETASISVLEAMANAMVTISTDENGTASYIKENINGNVFLSGNSFDLACKINEYLNNKKLIPTHGNNSYCNIVENYSFENYYYTLNNILFKEFNRRLE
nr:glycosyltransferase family 4 protein [Halobacillus litoralis]